MIYQTIAQKNQLKRTAVMLNAANNPPSIRYPVHKKDVSAWAGIVAGFGVGALCFVCTLAVFYKFIF